jgi:hypothetical protein
MEHDFCPKIPSSSGHNPRINPNAPHLFFAPLGFKSLVSLVAKSTLFRAQVMRNVFKIEAKPLDTLAYLNTV